MKDRKTVYRVFTPWQYENEVRMLNEMSAKGWQMAWASPYRVKFIRDDTVQYRDALD